MTSVIFIEIKRGGFKSLIEEEADMFQDKTGHVRRKEDIKSQCGHI